MGQRTVGESARFTLEESELGPIVHCARAPSFDTFLDGIDAALPGVLLDASPKNAIAKGRLPVDATTVDNLHGLGRHVQLLRTHVDSDIVVVWERTDHAHAEVAVLAKSWKRAAALMMRIVNDDEEDLVLLAAGRGRRRFRQ